ncbi:alpha/beta hydrolase [Ruminiclostridium papyrosolvens]|uniref:Peptidase S15 n=1 Tax=Ruminiclostridium papyrosolvens C7 TaxID=1330534 RepID=U4QZK4_9FIRM|nr:alpha/beta hydrolase [Ruminiclostridium papyrosolvens]EPR09485.1 peptidase S15 [Ruminiclostridium papyrosolvens C7]
MKYFVKACIIIVLIAFVVVMATGFYFYDISVTRTKKAFLAEDAALKKSVMVNAEIELKKTSSEFTDDVDWLSRQAYEIVDIVSYDGLNLQGYYLSAESPSINTVILSHGYSSKGLWMGLYAKLYNMLGYNVLMPDSRGHGSSEGNYIGFGWVDRKDYLKWIDFVIKKSGPDTNIVLHGVSMGGATVLMTGGENLPSNVKAIVSDCAYTSVKDELSYQMERMYHLPSFPLLNVTSIITKIKAGFTFEEASALKQVKKSKTPTLFIHGGNDEFVPTSMVNELFEACSSEKELFIVPGAGHGAALDADPDGYIAKVKDFTEKYINK